MFFFLLAFLSLRPCISLLVGWTYSTSELSCLFVYLCLHLTLVWRERCILWLNFVASVDNFAVERVCWSYSVHEQSSVFSWTNIRIHPTENRVNIYTPKYLFLDFGETKWIFLRWPWVEDFVILIFWIRRDVNHHTRVVKLSFVFICCCRWTNWCLLYYSEFESRRGRDLASVQRR